MRRVFKWLFRVLAVLILGVLCLAAAFAISGWESFGARPAGARQVRIERSPNWRDGAFSNIRALWVDRGLAYQRLLFGPAVPATEPAAPIVPVRPTPATFAALPASGLRVTWFGHSSVLVEIDGKRVLTDPIWSERASPVGWAGPRRWFAPPIALAQLPAIDAVVISHDHYDHLDRATIQALNRGATRFIVPLGIGAHLERWGVPAPRIVELDWWQRAQIGDLAIVATPARHATGRTSTSSNRVLWAGFALIGVRHRVWYSGDTGYLPEFAAIGARLGPFDLTLIESGQYDPAWPDNHLSPELATKTHQLVRGKRLLPVHWALFGLAPHGWTESVERTIVAARAAGVSLALPRPGESIEPERIIPSTPWWPQVPWRTAAEKPVLPTAKGVPGQRFAFP